MADSEDDVLLHFGVKGMKWGRRKADGDSSAPAPKAPKKELSPEQKKMRSELIQSAAVLGTIAAVKAGARWAANNPDKLTNIYQRANNVMNGTKAIGPGYDIVKMTLKNGVFV